MYVSNQNLFYFPHCSELNQYNTTVLKHNMDFVGQEGARLIVCSDVDEESLRKLGSNIVKRGYTGCTLIICGDIDDSARRSLAFAQDVSIKTMYLAVKPRNDDSDVISCAHNRDICTKSGLHLVGFTEGADSLKPADVVDSDSEDEGANIVLETSSSDIKDLLLNLSDSPSFRVLAVRYHFSHTLNQILFHMPEDLSRAKVKLCLIAGNPSESMRLPAKLGALALVGLASLRQTGLYCVVDLLSVAGEWSIISQSSQSLNE